MDTKIKKMKQLFFCCLGMLYWAQCTAQNIDSLVRQYTIFNAHNIQEKVYAQTDRTLYQPGDDIWLNAFVTNADNSPSIRSQQVYAELYNPKGSLVSKLVLPNFDGTAKGDFRLDKDAVGGQYTIKVYSYWMQNFDKANYFEKTLTVQKVASPEVLIKLDFEREAYGAGDRVTATFEARTKANQPLANKTIQYTVQLEGKQIHQKNATTNAEGKALLRYELPKELSSTNNLLNIQFQHDGLTEAISRSAPIILNDLDVQLLPEGGNLVANQINRVALKVLNEFGKPADISGRIVDQNRQEVTAVTTFHQGMGAFELKPEKGKRYHLEITQPTGIQKTWTLPDIDANRLGFYLKSNTEKALEFDVYSAKEQAVSIVAQQQGKLVYQQQQSVDQGATSVTIPIADLAVGIVQVTIFDAAEQAHVERLVFVHKDRTIKVALKTDKESYLPKEAVNMDISVTDEKGKGVQGKFSMAVVDDKQHVFADDKQDNILSYLLMSSDLKGAVYEPNFYFNPKEEKAAQALDYVMLTHGWRRFDWKEVVAYDGNTPINYPVDGREIAGFFKIGKELTKNQTIYLSEGQPRYTKKKALAVAQTDENGFFKFEDVEVDFPAYLCAQYHGQYHAIKVNRHSKVGTKSSDIPVYLEHGQKLNGSISAPDYTENYLTRTGNIALQGQVFDKETKEPIMFGKIQLIAGDSILNMSTDMDGNFQFINIPEGIYQLRAVYLGLSTTYIPQLIIRDEITSDFKIYMDENPVMLEVAVRSVAGSVESTPSVNRVRSVPKISRKSGKKGKVLKDTKQPDVTKFKEEGRKDLIAQANKKSEAAANKNLGGKLGVSADSIQLSNYELTQQMTKESSRVLEGVSAKEIAKTGLNSVSSAQDIITIRQTLPNTSNRYNVQSRQEDELNAFDEVASLYLEQVEPVQEPYSYARQFYHPKYTANTVSNKRTDFRRTIYWNPIIKTDEAGRASVQYYNSDEITTFRAILEGVGKTGKLVHAEQTYASMLPFSILAKIPTILTFGDKLKIPVVLKNNSPKPITGTFQVKAPAQLRLLKELPREITIPADSHQVVYLEYQVLFEQGEGAFSTEFDALNLSDAIEKTVAITPKGFPMNFAMSGRQLTKTDTFIIEDVYNGSLEGELNVYPNVLDGLMDGVESILNSPSGCFEQVSSSNYPNILALQLMEETQAINPSVRAKALRYLKKGYQKLAGYEIAGGGFEWYGRAPAHEGLTAYGLVQFNDMKAVYDGVNAQLVERTQKFLLSRRDGKGGFKQSVGKYGFSGNKAALFNAYITWALSETGTKGLEKEIATMTEEAVKSEDLYRMSLAALTQLNVGNEKIGMELLATIQAIVKKVGIEKVKAESTVTYSYGNALNLETLSFVALAMLKAKDCDYVLLEEIMQYILSKRQYGRFGSTQSTIMALKALSAYQAYSNRTKSGGHLMLVINGKVVQEKEYTKDEQQKMRFENLQTYFKEGQNIVTVKFEQTSEALPYSLDVAWTTKTPKSDVICPVALNTKLNRTTTKVGETVRLEADLLNLEDETLPSTMAVIGIPAGLSLQPWQLKELQEQDAFAFYEIADNYLILYYRSMDAKERKKLVLDLKTETPGVYEAPANAAYLYYGDEYKHWTKGQTIRIGT